MAFHRSAPPANGKEIRFIPSKKGVSYAFYQDNVNIKGMLLKSREILIPLQGPGIMIYGVGRYEC